MTVTATATAANLNDEIDHWIGANTRSNGTPPHDHRQTTTTIEEARELMHALAATGTHAAVVVIDNNALMIVNPQGGRTIVRWAAATGHTWAEVDNAGPASEPRVVSPSKIVLPGGRDIPWTNATAAAHGCPPPPRGLSSVNNTAADRIRVTPSEAA